MGNLDELLLGTRTAILVVDVQNDYCHPNGALAKSGEDVSGAEKMLPNLEYLISSARRFGCMIIFFQTIHDDSTDSEVWKIRSYGKMANVCRADSWGMEFYGISPEPDEVIVNKHKYSAFINTKLDSVLRAHKIETLIIAGVSTNVCVESTARDGFMLDYRIILLNDACASYSSQAHEMTLRNISKYFGTIADVQDIVEVWSESADKVVLLKPADRL